MKFLNFEKHLKKREMKKGQRVVVVVVVVAVGKKKKSLEIRPTRLNQLYNKTFFSFFFFLTLPTLIFQKSLFSSPAPTPHFTPLVWRNRASINRLTLRFSLFLPSFFSPQSKIFFFIFFSRFYFFI